MKKLYSDTRLGLAHVTNFAEEGRKNGCQTKQKFYVIKMKLIKVMDYLVFIV